MRALTFGLILLFAVGASAQPARPSWFSFGIGPSTAHGDSESLIGGAFQIVAPVGPGPLVVQVGVSGASENLGFVARSGDEVAEGHVGIGLVGKTGPVRLVAVLGPSMTRVALAEFDDSQGYRRRTRRTGRFLPGAYASVQGVVVLNRSLGLSAEAFGLANADLPTAGFRVGLVFGNL